MTPDEQDVTDTASDAGPGEGRGETADFPVHEADALLRPEPPFPGDEAD